MRTAKTTKCDNTLPGGGGSLGWHLAGVYNWHRFFGAGFRTVKLNSLIPPRTLPTGTLHIYGMA